MRRFRDLVVAIKELEPYILDGQHLQTGKPFRRLGGMRSREALANWLLCAVLNAEQGADEFYFATDPTGGDGVICNDPQQLTWLTEHVLVPNLPSSSQQSVEDKVVEKVCAKIAKGGSAYASGKTLVVFLNDPGGAWYPNRAAKQLPDPLQFDAVWTVGLHSAGPEGYIYGVANLDVSDGNAPSWLVKINPSFTSWIVERIQ